MNGTPAFEEAPTARRRLAGAKPIPALGRALLDGKSRDW